MGISAGGAGRTASRRPCDPGNCLGGMIIGSPRSAKRKRVACHCEYIHRACTEANEFVQHKLRDTIPQNAGGRFPLVES